MNDINLISYIQELLQIYKEKIDYGVVFKLFENEAPSELKKVLNLIKDKIKRWGNANIFTYIGNLFENFKVIVIGAENIEEAKYLIIFVYLSDILSGKLEMNPNISKDSLEKYLISEINNGLVRGFPFSKSDELDLKDHIDKIIKSELETHI